MMCETDPVPELETTVPTPQEEALAAWFAEQQTKSVDNLESAARQIIALCTTLLGALLGLLALTAATPPPYMALPPVRPLSGVAAFALFAALAAALTVVLPGRYNIILNDPDDLQHAFEQMLQRKRQGLSLAVWFFAAAMLCLLLVIVLALVQGN